MMQKPEETVLQYGNRELRARLQRLECEAAAMLCSIAQEAYQVGVQPPTAEEMEDWGTECVQSNGCVQISTSRNAFANVYFIGVLKTEDADKSDWLGALSLIVLPDDDQLDDTFELQRAGYRTVVLANETDVDDVTAYLLPLPPSRWDGPVSFSMSAAQAVNACEDFLSFLEALQGYRKGDAIATA
jgi:hypothetical protein